MKKFFIIFFAMIFVSSPARAEDINVAFTIDNNYPVFALLVINSILLNNDSNSHYNFYIVNNDLSLKNKSLMKKYVEKRGQNIEFIEFNSAVIDEGKNLSKHLGDRFSSIVLAKLALADILPKSVDRLIFLDGDVFVSEDLKSLYTKDLEGNLAGLVKSIHAHESLDVYPLANGYYSTGVILIDLAKWRDENISHKMTQFVKDNRDKFTPNETNGFNPTLQSPDQDVVNIVLNGRIKELESKWNDQTVSLKNEGIQHFTLFEKPWKFPKNARNEYKKYYSYWNKSGLAWYKIYYKIESWYSSIFEKKKNRFMDIKRWFMKHDQKLQKYTNIDIKINLDFLENG